MENKADVAIIGGGVIGTAILAALARYELDCVLLEKEPDIAAGTTKANSAVLHAGFDAPSGTQKAVMNVRGNQLYHALEKELDLDIKWTGSLVAALTEEDEVKLAELKARAKRTAFWAWRSGTGRGRGSRSRTLTRRFAPRFGRRRRAFAGLLGSRRRLRRTRCKTALKYGGTAR